MHCPLRPLLLRHPLLHRRCFAQLSLLGYILVPIFLANRWWLTLLYTLFMLVVAAVEAVSRPTQTYNGMLVQASSIGRHLQCGRLATGGPPGNTVLLSSSPQCGCRCLAPLAWLAAPSFRTA